MGKISFVYFDVGGVAIQDFSDSPKWGEMMDGMGIPLKRRAEFDKLYHTYDTQVCLGQHEDTFLPEIATRFHLTLPTGFSMRKYFLDHFFTNNEVTVSLAQYIKKTCKVGLLTDMYPDMLDDIFARKLMPAKATWDVIVDSSVVGFRKPMPEIYQIAQEKAGVKPEEILFIDNRQKNLVPAANLGWQTYFYDSRDYVQANRDLATYLQLPGL